MRACLPILAFTLCLAAAAPSYAADSPQAAKPLTKDQVMHLVKAGMDTAKLVKLIQDHGIDFDPSDGDFQALGQAGAQEAIIQALRDARPRPLTKDQVMQLVAQGVSSGRAALLVKQRGVDFLADDPYLETLRLAGGTDELISAVTRASAGVTLPIFRFGTFYNRPFYGADCMTFSPDGKLLAIASDQIFVFDVAAWQLKRSMGQSSDLQHFGGIEGVAFSPDGRLLASLENTGHTIDFWDAATGTLRKSLATSFARSVAFGPDGSLLASNSGDQVKLWEAATGTVERTMAGHTANIVSVAFSPDGKLLASGAWDKTVRIWDVATGTLRHTLTGHTSWVPSVAFSPDGRVLASASNEVKLWDAATGELRETIPVQANSLTFSPDGRFLATGGNDPTVKLWDAATGALSETLSGHTRGIASLAFSPDGKLLASGGADVILWRVKQ